MLRLCFRPVNAGHSHILASSCRPVSCKKWIAAKSRLVPKVEVEDLGACGDGERLGDGFECDFSGEVCTSKSATTFC